MLFGAWFEGSSCSHFCNHLFCASFMFVKLTPNPIDGSERATTPLVMRVVCSYLSRSRISVPRGSEKFVFMKQPTRLTSDVCAPRHTSDIGLMISASATS